jgi:hypothetical protein
MQKNIPQTPAQSTQSSIPAVAAHDEQLIRFEAKLKRGLGKIVLALLADDRAEDIVLNPDSPLWTKRIGEGFMRVITDSE